MGRGRQKAKQTRAARKLKYLTTDTDYSQLQKELSHKKQDRANDEAKAQEGEEDLDDYASWAAKSASSAELLKENVSLKTAMAKMAPAFEKENQEL
ncbi:MAG: DUF3073 domain-containing protein [Aeriscardovia sp.]|nr:DUF3073 domain-containing protein [Aeriscardovia sp.]